MGFSLAVRGVQAYVRWFFAQVTSGRKYEERVVVDCVEIPRSICDVNTATATTATTTHKTSQDTRERAVTISDSKVGT